MNKVVMGDSFSAEGETEAKPEVKENETVVEETPETVVEEKETPAESSTEEKPVVEPEATVVTEGEDDDTKQKALDALRKEEEHLDKDLSELDIEIKRRKDSIVEKRAERRDRREIIKTVDDVIPPSDDLADIDKGTLDILERYTKAKGLVPKSEFSNLDFAKEQKRSEKQFFQTHPQYLPENDKNDELYNELKKELALYAKPTDSEMLSVIYEKAHKAVKERFSDKFPTPANKTAVVRKRVEIASAGGNAGAGGSSKSGESKFTEKQLNIMRNSGYSEEDIKHLETLKK